MTTKSKFLGLLAAALCLGGLFAYLWFNGPDSDSGQGLDEPTADGGATTLQGDAGEIAGEAAEKVGEAGQRAAMQQDPASIIGVRGVVLDVKTRQPLPGVEVVALRLMPNLERPITRFRSMFTEGLWTDTAKPVKVLGSAITQGDGSFEMYGLPPGRVFLDARSDRAYIRNPGAVRLAKGQVRDGIELLAYPGGRVAGQVFGPEGAPAKNTRVSVRPGLNAFLGQLTQRKYKWLEAMTDEEGRFVISGVPTGDGYSVTIASPGMALEERHNIDVAAGQTVEMTVHGKIGASVSGRAVDGDGNAVPGAQVAMVYLDFSRMVFSADGRDEALTTDDNGYFQLQHVAPGRVAFIAATDSLAPSNIQELAVVDGGVYSDVVLTLDKGRTFTGIVVDGDDRPLGNVEVEIRPRQGGGGGRRGRGGEGPRGADALKMALKIRRVRSTTDSDGRFSTAGVAGDRISMQFVKSGYITILKNRVKVDEPNFKVVLTRGVTVRGVVQIADGAPIPRFRVKTRSREIEPAKAGGGKDAKSDDAKQDDENGVRVEVSSGGRGRRGGMQAEAGGRRGRRGRSSTTRMREGSSMMDRDRGSSWDEVKSAAGRFAIHGLPAGKITVEVSAEGYLDVESQKIELAPGESGEDLVFVLDPGAIARGVVKDAVDGQPIPEATVTAYVAKKKKNEVGTFALFKPDADPEDFDFLGMSGRDGNKRSAMADSKGRFEIRGLKGGDYRFTARHPDMAKTSVKDVKLAIGEPTEGIEIVLEQGGGIEGIVTGKGRLPLASAMVVAFSIQAGSFKSDATDARGFYRIDGLPPGQYIVFKSRMDERSQDLGMDLMSNMRLKTTTVKKNRTTKKDIHDESEDSVRVYGMVRDAGKPVPRAVITFLGRDRDGILGMGIRTKPTEDDGTYEMIGVEPGEYLVQIARFRNRAEQVSLTVEIPAGVREYRLNLDMPQSFVEGIVQDTQGNPVPGVQVQVGLQEDAPIDGLVGIMLKNGLAQSKTDANGRFQIKGLAEGVYRVTASGRGISMRRGGVMPQIRAGGGRGKTKWGEVALEDIQLDGVTPQTGLLMILPRAGSITGVVVDGSGNVVKDAKIFSTNLDRQKRREASAERALTDLFGLQLRPIQSGSDGRFELDGLTPGKYRVRAEFGDLAPGTADEVIVVEGQPVEIRLEVMKGATLKVRVRNIDGGDVPIANITVLDGKGKPLAQNVSAMSVFMRYMRGKKKKDTSGWHEIGGIRPDTYTLIIKEKGQEEIRIVRTVKDGEKAKWDIDMAAEMKNHRATKK